jgi:hypothetical protein
MNNDNTQSKVVPELVAEFVRLLEGQCANYKQKRVYLRVMRLVMGMVLGTGRRTVTQALLALGQGAGSWHAYYRLFSYERFKEELAARLLVLETLQHVAEEQVYAIAMDGTSIVRSSLQMAGTMWSPGTQTAKFDRGLERMQRFLTCAWLTPLMEGYSRAIPLRFLPIFAPSAVLPDGMTACREWEGGLKFIDWLRKELDHAGRQQQRMLVLVDTAFETIEMWKQLPEEVILLVCTRRNRRLYWWPKAEKRVGRPAVYGEKAPCPADFWRQQGKAAHWTETSTNVRGVQRRMRYRIIGPVVREDVPGVPLFLIVLGGYHLVIGKRRKKNVTVRPRAYLINTQVTLLADGERKFELPLPLEEMLAWLWQRWEVEVTHREMKSGFGVGDIQAWNPKAAVLSVQFSAWVYALLMLTGLALWGMSDAPPPVGKWRRTVKRWSITNLLAHLRTAILGQPEFKACWLHPKDDPLDIQTWFAALNNSLATSGRL